MVKGSYTTSTVPTYEPYTGGIASPNPDYPQKVENVEGDNVINVFGKNLINVVEVSKGVNSSGVISGIDTHYLGIGEYVPCKPSTTYTITFQHDISTLSMYIGYKDIDGNFINRVSSSSRTFTTPNNAYSMYVYVYKDDRFDTAGGYVQLEYGSTATAYTPYVGKDYRVQLGYENLWKPITTTTKSGITMYYNPDDGSYTLTGTSTAATSFYVSANYPVGTYTLSANNKDTILGGADYLLLETSGGTSTNKTLAFSVANNKATFDVTSPITTLVIVVSSGKTYNNFKFYPMLTNGSEERKYRKYGEQVIELCKIGNYQDYIFKSTVTNLSNGENQSYYINQAHTSAGLSANNSGLVIPITGNTYTVSTTVSQTRYRVACIDTLPELNGTTTAYNGYTKDGTSDTITIDTTNHNYLVVNATDLSNIMVNVGSSALPFEPYGIYWYKYCAVGKVIYNGTENWQYESANLRFSFTLYNLLKQTGSRLPIYSNYFNYPAEVVNRDGIGFAYYYNGANGTIFLYNYACTDAATFKTWLSSHNTVVYYQLEVPTYTRITDETLIEQLETQMYSQIPQTNITQTNDGQPFDLGITLSFTQTMNVTNIGNIYAKPVLTLEGIGNVGIILNDIEILSVDFGDGGKITIDVPNLQAYDPDDNTLLNRLVTGDYMKLLIQEGDNTIAFSGSVTSATLTNYTRWI